MSRFAKPICVRERRDVPLKLSATRPFLVCVESTLLLVAPNAVGTSPGVLASMPSVRRRALVVDVIECWTEAESRRPEIIVAPAIVRSVGSLQRILSRVAHPKAVVLCDPFALENE